jgi:hypothetical protein
MQYVPMYTASVAMADLLSAHAPYIAVFVLFILARNPY